MLFSHHQFWTLSFCMFAQVVQTRGRFSPPSFASATDMDASQSETPHGEDMAGDEREATELRCHESRTVPVIDHRPTTISHGWSLVKVMSKMIPMPVSGFWRHQISASVPHAACRDHLGMCELFKPAITWAGLPSIRLCSYLSGDVW